MRKDDGVTTAGHAETGGVGLPDRGVVLRPPPQDIHKHISPLRLAHTLLSSSLLSSGKFGIMVE